MCFIFLFLSQGIAETYYLTIVNNLTRYTLYYRDPVTSEWDLFTGTTKSFTGKYQFMVSFAITLK